ncbi:hypothetical protein [Marinobacter sp.]
MLQHNSIPQTINLRDGLHSLNAIAASSIKHIEVIQVVSERDR